jgi:hypothetical protein
VDLIVAIRNLLGAPELEMALNRQISEEFMSKLTSYDMKAGESAVRDDKEEVGP